MRDETQYVGDSRVLSSIRLFAVMTLLLGMTNTIHAQDGCEVDKLLASDGASNDGFGGAIDVSADANAVIIGASQVDSSGIGKAYVFRREATDWTEQATLFAPNGEPEDFFGWSVAISAGGDIAVVGAIGSDGIASETGAAYVFRFDGSSWEYEATLAASDGAIYDSFGGNVDISTDGSTIAISADGTKFGGTVYIFCYDANQGMWTEEAILWASDTSGFGDSLLLFGDTILIGAPSDFELDVDAGAVFVFEFDAKSENWIEQDKLLASDGGDGDWFGSSIAVDQDVAIIGASEDVGCEIGAAYIFTLVDGNWVEQQRLNASDGEIGDYFGGSVALEGETALIGTIGDNDNGVNSGSIYVFRFDADLSMWIEDHKLLASDGVLGDFFGRSVTVSGDVMVAGTTSDDDNGNESGSAYVFLGVSGEDCNDNGASDSCDILDGTSDDINENGIPDECEELCPWDIDGDGSVGAADLLGLLVSWGPCKGCPADFDGDGNVGASDLLALLANWGPCP